MIEPKIKVYIWDIEYHKEKTAVSADLFRYYYGFVFYKYISVVIFALYSI